MNENEQKAQQSKNTTLRSVEEALSELTRELQVRQRCYSRWIAEGKLTTVDARDRMERMQAAVEYLQRTFDLQQVTGEMSGQQPD